MTVTEQIELHFLSVNPFAAKTVAASCIVFTRSVASDSGQLVVCPSCEEVIEEFEERRYLEILGEGDTWGSYRQDVHIDE